MTPAPSAALKPCPWPGCPELTTGGRCPAHSRDILRGTTAERGYDSRWQRVRLLVLKRDKYLCQSCSRRGVTTFLPRNASVDHVIPIEQRPDLRLDMANLQSTCWPCHNAKTHAPVRVRQERRVRYRVPRSN